VFLRESKVVLLKEKGWFFLLLLVLIANVTTAAVNNKVVVSTHPLALITAELVPKTITVESVGGRNHSLHHQGFKPSQIKRVSEAELVLWLGPETDVSFVKVMAKAEPMVIRDLSTLVSLQAPLLSLPSQSGDHDHRGVDMHVWLNPQNALVLAAEISVQLVYVWPQYQVEIEENLRQFNSKIGSISSEVLIKNQNRDFLALHNAYGHLAKFYGLTPIGAIVGGGGEKPGALHLWQLEKQLSGRDAVCVLVQPQFSQRYLSSISSVVAVVTAEIDPAASHYHVAKGEFVRYSKEVANHLATCIGLKPRVGITPASRL
jgi:zinc transport system substrate-binding protein